MAKIGLLKKLKRQYDEILEEARLRVCKKSYSQSGEDLIIDYIFTNYLKILKPTYLDIGAHHPKYLSNTYYFYEKGCNGVCIEPDPVLYKTINKERKRDICLNVGVGVSSQTKADFYLMSTKTLNTFSKEEAERYQSYGQHKIEEIVKLPLVNINDVIKTHFTEHPNFVSLDVEGLDLDVLKSIDFKRFRPEVFCVETLTYTVDNTETKLNEIIEFMIMNEYMVYADTYINTIFIDKKTWNYR